VIEALPGEYDLIVAGLGVEVLRKLDPDEIDRRAEATGRTAIPAPVSEEPVGRAP